MKNRVTELEMSCTTRRNHIQDCSMRFDEKFSDLMGRRGLSAAEVSRALKDVGIAVSPATVRRWGNREALPDIYEAAALADLFDVPLAFLARDEMESPPGPGLSKEEQYLLQMIRDMGIPSAKNRLLAVETGKREGETLVFHPRATPGINRGGSTDPHPGDRDPAGSDEPLPHGPEPDPGRRPTRRR